MGLLDVNMPMLYGEGKKAFHHLQLEMEFAHQTTKASLCGIPVMEREQPGSILADDPSSKFVIQLGLSAER